MEENKRMKRSFGEGGSEGETENDKKEMVKDKEIGEGGGGGGGEERRWRGGG